MVKKRKGDKQKYVKRNKKLEKLIFVSFLLSYRLRRIDDLRNRDGYFLFFERRRKKVNRAYE